MKRVVIPLSFPPMSGAESGEVDFEISDPGEIVDCLIQVKPKVGGIVMAQNAGKPEFEFIPTMMVVIDPDATPKKRKFLVTQPMLVAETEAELIFRGRFLFPDGRMLVVFEETESKEQKRNLLMP